MSGFSLPSVLVDGVFQQDQLASINCKFSDGGSYKKLPLKTIRTPQGLSLSSVEKTSRIRPTDPKHKTIPHHSKHPATIESSNTTKKIPNHPQPTYHVHTTSPRELCQQTRPDHRRRCLGRPEDDPDFPSLVHDRVYICRHRGFHGDHQGGEGMFGVGG